MAPVIVRRKGLSVKAHEHTGGQARCLPANRHRPGEPILIDPQRRIDPVRGRFFPGRASRGQEWYETRVLPRIGPVALYGPLFTVVILFLLALQSRKITSEPLDVARIALPLLAYFAIMWAAGFAISRRRPDRARPTRRSRALRSIRALV